ncbi:peptide deformylase [Desulfitibacter alkalitolerans]|uniref:peptide deformylase n=1 Tax=Desulfitibacter alkalitolerans TaxID=264641 RepID=UPI0004816033|nr:peptide deformylase [Desulfitibacter alkalitolerans]
MAIYQIVKVGDNILREKAKPVPNINSSIIKLLDNMQETMKDALGVGLAAPQVGVSKRVIIVDIGEGLIELINPEIVNSEGTKIDVEGCLSIPGVRGNVPRGEKIVVAGLNRHGERVEIEAKGLLARAFQHEIDHLDGTLFIDIADNIEKID